jgi:hypothetical protein
MLGLAVTSPHVVTTMLFFRLLHVVHWWS